MIEEIRAAPWRYGFFQAVRSLERALSERAKVGNEARPDDESIRFRSRVSLAFPASDIQSLEVFGDGALAMEVSFMGIANPMSPGSLPVHYAELLADLAREKNDALREFFDLFNHRAISLFYRAWKKHRFEVGFEERNSLLSLKGSPGSSPSAAADRPAPASAVPASPGDDAFTSALFCLLGLGTAGLRQRLPFADHALLPFAGTLPLRGGMPREALEALLESYFSVRVEVEEFRGARLQIEPEEETRLGAAHSRLGVDAALGDAVWDVQSRIRIRLGPMPLERYRGFLPPGSAFAPLSSMVRLAAGPHLDAEVQPILEAEEVPDLELPPDPEHSLEAPRLGWSSWLISRTPGADARDAVFLAEAAPPDIESTRNGTERGAS